MRTFSLLRGFSLSCLAFAATAMLTSDAMAVQRVRVEITNHGPTNGGTGVALTPVWVGFHNGSFDSYNGGLTSQPGLERIAEDGDPSIIAADFQGGYTYIDSSGGSATSARVLTAQTTGRVDGVLASPTGPPPVESGETVVQEFDIEIDGSNRYFSYASMVLPTNDFFVANGSPFAHDLMSLYDGSGTISFNIGGFNASPVNDAGTEAESYLTSAGNGLFGLAGGQGPPGTIDVPAGSLNLPIANVNGPLPVDALMFDEGSQPDFDFNNGTLYPNGIATITITAIPEPSTLMLGALSVVGLCGRRFRRQ